MADASLHLTKVAVGCAGIEALAARHAERLAADGRSYCLTRYMPTRAGELVGGSLFWIIKHTLVARQEILKLEMIDTELGTKCAIILAPVPIEVLARPRRAHQGWRYLAAADAPPDLRASDHDLRAVPPAMMRELQALWLV
ncbi:MAG: DUF1489 family protein [Janthinobacterium lividum]